MSCVVQAWMHVLSWKQQAVILAAIRGCDGKEKTDPSKTIVRLLRSSVLHNADPNGTFISAMTDDERFAKATGEYLDDLDHYPVHFVLHLMFAAEIIGYMGPPGLRSRWKGFYVSTVRAMHLNPETAEQMMDRLADPER